MKKKGMTLLELMMSVAIGSFILSALLFLVVRSQVAYRWESNRSQELRDLTKAMSDLSDIFSRGSTYLVAAGPNLLSDEGSSEVEIEQFSRLYRNVQFVSLIRDNNRLLEKVYLSPTGLTLAHEFKNPSQEIVLAKTVKNVLFRFKPPRVLEITLSSEHFSFQTSISSLRLSSEASR